MKEPAPDEFIGLDLDEALRRLSDRGTARVRLIICRDRKSADFTRLRVVRAKDADDVRLTVCGFPEPRKAGG